jgi:hypothetical protein
MTELYINGQSVILPANVEFSVVEDNPFLTKSGEYSLDLELSLQNPVNAKIFKHIGRFHQQGDPDTFSAILIADNLIRMRGTAVVLSHTDTRVKIQLLSGNSDLNYFIGSDKKIEDLDLGTEAAITESQALASLTKKYPESNYVCTTVLTKTYSVLNVYTIYTGQPETISNIAMMPYLLYYVQKILQVLGYSIEENQLLDDELLCRLYIPNAKKTLQYNKILSGWTVQDFLIEIEKFCNVVFVIDKEKSSVRIVRFYNFDKNNEKIYIDKVIDEYEEEYDSENEIDTINYEHVKYALPEDEYYKYKHLHDSVLENVTVEEYETFQDLRAALNPLSDYYNKNKIYHVNKHVLFGFIEIKADNYYIVQKLMDNLYDFVRVNEFQDTGEKDDNTIELKIIPAEMTTYIYPDSSLISSTQASRINDEIVEEGEEENKLGVIDLIESNSADNDNTSSNTIPVAIFAGKLDSKAPWSQVDLYVTTGNGEIFLCPDYYKQIAWDQLLPSDKEILINRLLGYTKFTLRLSGQYGLFNTNYSLNKNISSKVIRKISFVPKGKISPQNTFVIKNKEFICISLETKFNNRGALPVVEGTFYPVD